MKISSTTVSVPSPRKKELSMINVSKDEDGTFEYETFGDDKKQQLYMFPGFGGTLQKWSREFIENLSNDFQVITFNYPGVGESKTTKEITSFDEYSDYFSKLFTRLNKGKDFSLFGYSMGIYVVRNIILKHKELSPKNVVFCSGSFGGKFRIPSSPEVMAQLKTAGSNNLSTLMSKEKLMSNEDYVNSFVHPTEEQSTKELLDFQGKLIYKFFGEHCEDKPENKIAVDALVVHGSNDMIFSTENAKILHSFCTKRSKLHLTNGGHLQTFEYPIEVASEIKAFCL